VVRAWRASHALFLRYYEIRHSCDSSQLPNSHTNWNKHVGLHACKHKGHFKTHGQHAWPTRMVIHTCSQAHMVTTSCHTLLQLSVQIGKLCKQARRLELHALRAW
jgi:hypothetical protein